MYKVFYLSKEIIFTQSDKEIITLCHDIVIKVDNIKTLATAYQEYINEESKGRLVFLCHDKVGEVFKNFSLMFKNVKAAGGLVQNEMNELLMIFRLGKWDLPKGKIEKGESAEIAAIREVNEETALSSIQIIKKLEPSFHIYYVNNRKFLKTTYWYEMKCRDKESPVPQTEEGITMVEWLNKKSVQRAKKNTYDSLLDLLNLYLET